MLVGRRWRTGNRKEDMRGTDGWKIEKVGPVQSSMGQFQTKAESTSVYAVHHLGLADGYADIAENGPCHGAEDRAD